MIETRVCVYVCTGLVYIKGYSNEKASVTVEHFVKFGSIELYPVVYFQTSQISNDVICNLCASLYYGL